LAEGEDLRRRLEGMCLFLIEPAAGSQLDVLAVGTSFTWAALFL